MIRKFDPVQLGSIEIFLKAAETLSFAKAANELGLSAPAVSRSIARLEARLGARLFVRSTRRMNLSDDGQLYFTECKQALRQIADAEDTLSGRQDAPSGLIRISIPTTYAHYRIIPILPAFSRRYPDIQIEVNITNRNVDFVGEGFDLAIRLGELPDSQLVARRLEDAYLGVFASPDYLSANNELLTPADLKHHTLAQFERPSSGRPMAWLLRDGSRDFELSPKPGVMFSEDFLGCVSFALAGGCLVQTYDFIAERYCKTGELVEVLCDYRGRSRPFSIIYPQNRNLAPRVRVFIDFLLRSLKPISPYHPPNI
jgi:DNA-binding transcriptional LysR family regulator